MKYFLVLLALVAIVCAFPTEDELKAKFADFTHKYQKVYTKAEFAQRFENFKASIARAERHQISNSDATYGITKFSDMSTEEFKSKVLMTNRPARVERQTPIGVTVADPNPPSTFDWRDKNAVTAVKDQGQCGSCWAFSASEAIESAWILKGHATKSSINLSPQQIVDCDTIDGVQGCNGGLTESAYQYIMQAGGQEQIKDYPYTAVNGQCKFNKADVDATISGYKPIAKDETALTTNLANIGPLSICLDAAHWQDYQKGVMSAAQCCPLRCSLDHCVQLVGYNSNATTPYWIVRNSWNTDWGIDGYIWLAMGHNTCGLTNDITWPTSN